MGTKGRRLRVLYISAHLPYPPWSGGRRRELEFIRRLSRRVDFTLCVSSRTYDEDRRHRLAVLPYVETLRLARADRRDGISGLPQQVVERLSVPLANRVEQLLREERFDLIHVEGYYLLDHVPHQVNTPVLLVEHNLEYELLRQMASVATDPAKRAGLFNEAESTRRHEHRAWRRADICGFVSPEDCASAAETLGGDPWFLPHGGDHLTAPPGQGDRQSGRTSPNGASRDVLFVGNFAYAPSADAARILLRDILPEIHGSDEAVRLVLVGPGLPKDLLPADPSDHRIVVAGVVAELDRWFRQCAVFVAPLRIGGGTKFKLLEAMAAHCAIVTTPVGARGLPGAVDAMAVVDADGIAEATVDLLKDDARREQLRQSARRAFEAMPTWEECAQRMLAAYQTLSGRDLGSLNRAPCPSSVTTTPIPIVSRLPLS